MTTPSINHTSHPAHHEGCAEFNSSLASRRSFLKGLGVVTAGGVMATMHGTVFRQVAFAASGSSANVLVVLSMRGGADGLSLVVPYKDPLYSKLRPTIGIPDTTLLQKDDTFGLHPFFAPLEPLWVAGQMAAVHAVGLPVPNRSHFSAMEAVEEANPGSPERIGWLNRMVGMTEPELNYAAVQIGNGVPHTQTYGPQPTLACLEIEKIDIYGPQNAMVQRKKALDITWRDVDTSLGNATRVAMQTAEDWQPVRDSPSDPQHGANYPATDLGDALAQSARLIRADVGAQVVTVDHGSWDMHTDLGTLDFGQMRIMVDDLAKSVAAFFTDLGDLGSNVTLLTISEFGRRVQENGDAGLDHGYGNVMFLLGGGVQGGKYYAPGWPGLDQLKDGDLKVTTDYRDVLSEVVQARFSGVDQSKLFPGFHAQPIGVMRGG